MIHVYLFSYIFSKSQIGIYKLSVLVQHSDWSSLEGLMENFVAKVTLSQVLEISVVW